MISPICRIKSHATQVMPLFAGGLSNIGDQQHKEIEKLHLKLEGALRTLGEKQTIFDQHSMENVNLKKVADQNKSDSKKHEKQIENLRKSLMKSESERLILRREYMEIGSTLKRIQRDQVEAEIRNCQNTLSFVTS